MRRTASLAVFIALVGTPTLAGSAIAQESSVVGSWITATWEGQDDSQPGLLIFTETNYSIMFVIPGMTRERYEGEAITDDEIVTAYNTLVANSGRYTRDGNEITTEAYVTLNPNYMADWGENHTTYTFRIEGDILHLSWPADFMEDGSPGFNGTFRKVG